MKVIALMPVRNEEWILPYTLNSLKQFADEVVILNDRSIDNSKQIALDHGCFVQDIDDQEKAEAFANLRNKLLAIGRELGGTHFIFLDGDECFSQNFLLHFKSLLQNMQKGQKLQLRWLSVWKSPFEYRDDNTLYANGYKDFVFCDDLESLYDDRWIHEGRTPGPNTESNCIKIGLEDGAVLHYQFVNWNKYQLKQIWYRCIELLKVPNNYIKINRTYMFTLKENVKTSPILPSWYPKASFPENILNSNDSWHKYEILKLFDKYKIEFFERLDIWHIDDLREEFIKRMGRKPKQKIQDKIMKYITKVYYFLKGY